MKWFLHVPSRRQPPKTRSPTGPTSRQVNSNEANLSSGVTYQTSEMPNSRQKKEDITSMSHMHARGARAPRPNRCRYIFADIIQPTERLSSVNLKASKRSSLTRQFTGKCSKKVWKISSLSQLLSIEAIILIFAGWRFATPGEDVPGDNVTPDPHHTDFTHLRQIYFKVDSEYKGRFTVPTLYDCKQGKIVNNEVLQPIHVQKHTANLYHHY